MSLRTLSGHQGTAFERIAAKLDGHQMRITCHGTQLTALCPAHTDRTPSLSVRASRTLDGRGRIYVKCFAGCTDEAVLAALGLGLADLYDEPRRCHSEGLKRSYLQPRQVRVWR